MVVREAGLWGSPTWPVNDSILRTANGIQLHHTRDMLKVGRTPGESWVEWNTRSLRLARIALVKYEIPRTLEELRTPPRETSSRGEAWPGGNKRRRSLTRWEPDTPASSTHTAGTTLTPRGSIFWSRTKKSSQFLDACRLCFWIPAYACKNRLCFWIPAYGPVSWIHGSALMTWPVRWPVVVQYQLGLVANCGASAQVCANLFWQMKQTAPDCAR